MQQATKKADSDLNPPTPVAPKTAGYAASSSPARPPHVSLLDWSVCPQCKASVVESARGWGSGGVLVDVFFLNIFLRCSAAAVWTQRI